MGVCSDKEQPMAVQIVGNCPNNMAKAALILQDKGAAFVDINMGCPAKKIVSNGSGSALMKDIKLSEKIIKSVKNSVNLPVTVKFRSGWDFDNINAVEFAQMAQDSGADAVCVHGRTKTQMYAGKANWDIIAKVKQSLSIPVIGNGDVCDSESAKNMLEHTKCDGIMIGRGIMGRPWLASSIFKSLQKKQQDLTINVKNRKNLTLRHFDLLLEYYGNYKGLRVSRKHVSWYLKGLKNSNEFRNKYNKIQDANLARSLICNFYDGIKD
jgi:tRNA-dihydrouridine synthase B